MRKMTSAKQIFDLLPGIWRLRRETLTTLKDWQQSGCIPLKANGFAAFTSIDTDPNVLIYSEKIKVIDENGINTGMNGSEFKQRYKYRYDPSASTLTKYFFDDRIFYKLQIDARSDSESTEATASNSFIGCGEHLCIQDLYEANYSFASDVKFELKYKVNGPKKCYEIINNYEKCSSSEIAQMEIRIENGEIL